MKDRFDLLLRGGMVIDPASRRQQRLDIAISGGIIARIAEDISPDSARRVIELRDCVVTPGLVDMHCHLYPSFPVEPDGLPCIHPDAHLFQSGVTTAVDAGTCGIRDFVRFKERIVDRCKVRILAMLNIADGGMVNLDSEQNPANFHAHAVAGMAKDFADIVVGVKTAHYWVNKPFTPEHPAWASVDRTLEAARLCGLPAMFDFWPMPPERSYQELVLEKLEPGDIHTHMYAQQFPVLDEQGRVSDFLRRARERGVLFDLGHGAGSFWLRNAVPAWEQGFAPDTLSTDLYFDNIAGPVYGLTHIMSKYLSIGMPLEEVVYRTTLRPAEVIGHPELGRLSEGGCADIAVLKLQEGDFGFADAGGARLRGSQRVQCEMTLRGGEIVYDINARSLTDWQDAPQEYWHAPGVIHY